MSSVRISYLTDIAPSWKKAIASSAGAVRFFSPYITHKSLVETFKVNTDCEIYTVFEAELFISGASSLAALKTLISFDNMLYHLPGLHAKLILVPDGLTSVGSQNLTARGTRNKELSAAFSGGTPYEKISTAIEPWMDERIPITPEMIDHMEKLVAAHIDSYKALREASVAIDEEVMAGELDRQKERLAEEARIAKQRVARARRVEMQRMLKRARISLFGATCAIRDLSKVDSVESGFSLVAPSYANLTHWRIEQQQIELHSTYRYLCVIPETGKLGWARVFQTRISFISQSVISKTHMFSHLECKLHLVANWGPDMVWNLRVLVKSYGPGIVCTVNTWFGVASLKILEIIPGDNQYSKAFAHWLARNKSTFREAVLKDLLEPFVYKKNLSGVRADNFFGRRTKAVRLRLANLGESRSFLIADLDL